MVAVSTLSANDAWAVGQYTTANHVYKTLLVHWDGASWNRVHSPNPGRADPTLLWGVSSVSPTDAWAVGEFGPDESAKTLIVHWDGSTWSRVHSPNPGGTSVGHLVAGVSADSSTNAWAAGFYYKGTKGKKLTLHWDGTRWTK